MAFESFGIASNAIVGTAPTIFVASTADDLATITTAGYLDAFLSEGQFKENDIFYINYLDASTFPLYPSGESATLGLFYASITAGVTTLTALPLASLELNASVPISSAEFLGMYAAPKLLIAAPGANNLIVVKRMELVMTYNSAAYAAGGVVAAQWDSTVHGGGSLATNSEAAADFFAAASTTFMFNGNAGNTVGAVPFSASVNKGLYLSNDTAAFTTGDSAFVAKINYQVISVV